MIVGIEKTGAKIGRSSSVDDRTAHDVRPLFKGKAFGNAVVNYRLAVAVYPNDFLAIDPPDRGRVRANGKAHVPTFPADNQLW